MHYKPIRLYRSPDAEPTPAPPAAGEAPDRGIPDDIDDLLYLAGNVSGKWATMTWLTTQAITQEDFATLVTTAKNALALRRQRGASQTVKTNQLETLDEQADLGTKKIKAYLVGKYEDEEVARQYYGLFGIVQEGNNYRLPRDRQDRLGALDIMISAVAAQGFGTKEYGTAFWTTYKTNYAAALASSADGSSVISEVLGVMDPMVDQIRKVLVGLRFIIRGNYVDTYQQAWRQFGFLAENN